MSQTTVIAEANTQCTQRHIWRSSLIGRLAVVAMATFFGILFLRMGPNGDIVGGLFCLAVVIMALLPEPSTLTAPENDHGGPAPPRGRSF